MKKRLPFACWNCQKPYSLFLEIEGKPKLNVECPYCGKDGVADLNPYRDDIVEIVKSSGAKGESIGTVFNFSNAIPTAPPQD